MELVHRPTFRLNTVLAVVFVALAIVLWQFMPERYPVHFTLDGEPTRWSDRNPGTWILVVALCLISFGQGHLFQRFLINDPDSSLLNVPHKKQFQKLSRERKVRVIRRTNRLLGLANTSLLLICSLVLLMMFAAAHSTEGLLWTLLNRGFQLLIVGVVVYPVVEYVLMRRMIEDKLRDEGLLPGH
ncbi:MAG: DUF1648 domain-containing protein [Gemmatimonadales bacterium]|nr:MAG: DUF1648 domain-containing protein [Gemmatimonadales bacterium]